MFQRQSQPNLPRTSPPSDGEDPILDAVASLVVVLDAGGRIVGFNRACERATGLARRDVLGRGFADVFPPVVADGAASDPPEDGSVETACTAPDGRRRRIAWSRGRVAEADGGDARVVYTGTDVTDDEARRESEGRFRAAVEASPDIMFFQDTDLRVAWVSRGVPPLTPADFVGKTDAELVGPTEAGRLEMIKRRVLATGVPERTEVEFVAGELHLSLEVVLVRRTDGAGGVLGLAGYARDVTERRQIERALEELNRTLELRVAERTESLRFSEERFRLIVEQAPVSVQILSPDGRTLRVNEAFRRLFGVGAEELADYNILADPQLEANGVMPELRRAFAGGMGFVRPVPYVPDRGPLAGQQRWAQALIYPVKGEAGEVREVVIVHEDVTDRHRAEEQLRENERHYRELAERNRLLVQEVEHRVGNNLAGLLALVARMRGRVRDVDAFAASIEARLRAMTRVHRMLVGSGWGAVGLRELVMAVLGGMGQMAPCAAAERVAGPDVPVPPKLALPLMFILAEWHTNSCKYGAHSAPGGRVDVEWAEGAAAPEGVEGRRVRLTWRERGGPPVREPVTASVGTELVRAFAATELRGSCTMTYTPAGAEHAVEFVVPG